MRLEQLVEKHLSEAMLKRGKHVRTMEQFKALRPGTIIEWNGHEMVIQKFYEATAQVSLLKHSRKGPGRTHYIYDYRYADEWDVFVLGEMPEEEVPQGTKLGR